MIHKTCKQGSWLTQKITKPKYSIHPWIQGCIRSRREIARRPYEGGKTECSRWHQQVVCQDSYHRFVASSAIGLQDNCVWFKCRAVFLLPFGIYKHLSSCRSGEESSTVCTGLVPLSCARQYYSTWICLVTAMLLCLLFFIC